MIEGIEPGEILMGPSATHVGYSIKIMTNTWPTLFTKHLNF